MADSPNPSKKKGKVFLVGAGPGDPDLITIRGRRLLRTADVVVYDDLGTEKLLDYARHNSEKICVGKRGGEESVKQENIDQILVQKCQEGKSVVRLKCGDPFVFGRAAFEMAALRNSGCDFEVVPGISTALAAPLLEGIPLTNTDISNCFAVLTGHDVDALDWDALSKIDTLSILMAGKSLELIAAKLLAAGRSPSTPVAAIKSAGTASQKMWVGTLETIVEETVGESLSPCVIVIGDVVSLRDHLSPEQPPIPDVSRSEARWSALDVPEPEAPKPLLDKTVMVTRSVSQSSDFTSMLLRLGAQVVEVPSLEIGPPSNFSPLDNALERLSSYSWLILTSANAVDYTFGRLVFLHQAGALGESGPTRDLSAYAIVKQRLAGVNIAVVGKKTEGLVRRWGLTPQFVPPNFDADSLVANFPDRENLHGVRMLFPRVESGGRDVLVKEMTALGAVVTEVAAYESRCPARMPTEAIQMLLDGLVDFVTFASSKTVSNWMHMLDGSLRSNAESFQIVAGSNLGNWVQVQDRSAHDILHKVKIVSIGPQTSRSCESILGRVDLEAKVFTLDGMAHAIIAAVEAEGES